MARKTQKFAPNPSGVFKARQWFASRDSDVTGVADWDIKQELCVQAIMGVLGTGCAIMLGTTMSGQAISVTVFDGDDKQRRYATDSIEFDDLMDALWTATHPRGDADQPTELRLAGD